MTRPPSADVGPGVRVEFCHAALQHIADQCGVDLLHIKGVAFEPQWRLRPRGSDADVLVRPSHVPRFLAAMASHGWQRRSRFQTGSPFEHAQTHWHDHFGYADIHRFFPGMGADDATFDVLWAGRGSHDLAAVPCPVPSPAPQALIFALNLARNAPGGPDGWVADPLRDDPIREQVEALVPSVRAEVGWAAARGRLDEVRHHRDHDLWLAVTHRRGRVEEWRARVKAEPTLRGKVRTVLRIPLVNVEHLTNVRGRRPSPWEVGVEFVDRFGRAAAEVWRARRASRRGP